MPPKRRANAEELATSSPKKAKVATGKGKATEQTKNSPIKARGAAQSNGVVKSQSAIAVESPQKTRSAKGRTRKEPQVEVDDTDEQPTLVKTPPSRKKAPARGRKAKVNVESPEESEEELVDSQKSTRAPAKRKSKAEKEAEAMPLKPRTSNLRMFVGAHVSGAGGVQNSVTNAVHIGGNAFALFLKSQRKWENPPLKDEHRDGFKTLCAQHGYAAHQHVLPHGSYLVNLAQSEQEKADQAYDAFLDDLKRCDALGIKLYNFHPGNTGPHPRAEAISRIAQQLNKAITATTNVVPVLETMATGGNAIGSTFEDIRDIITEVEDKSRIGVCIDTCHIFAAGYDIRSPETFKETIDQFDETIGLKYLRAFHVNDSKAPFGSRRDLHQNIGLGFIGLRAFHSLMNEPRFENIPMVLETPTDQKDENGKSTENKSIWADEIKLLEGLIGIDPSNQTFLDLEKELAAKGADERKKYQGQVDKKAEKDSQKSGDGKRQKKIEDAFKASETGV